MPAWPNSSPLASPKRQLARSPPRTRADCSRHSGRAQRAPESITTIVSDSGTHLREPHFSWLWIPGSRQPSRLLPTWTLKDRSRINRDRLRPGMTSSHRLKRREHVLDDTVGMFETDREPHQSVGDADLGTLRRREPLVRRRRRVRDQALGVAEIVADADELERVLETERSLLAALDLESDQGRAATHLLLHHRGLRMIGPAG